MIIDPVPGGNGIPEGGVMVLVPLGGGTGHGDNQMRNIIVHGL